MSERFVIVGAGQAGAWVARTLRSQGFSGTVTLIGSEPHHPYERPPLSKAILLGGDETQGTLLDAAEAAQLGIVCLLGETVTRIDREARKVTCAGGRQIAYDRLFLTTGSRLRPVPWVTERAPSCRGERVHSLRTREDARHLRAALAQGAALLVVGGGLIGLEVAAAARMAGCAVTVVEADSRLCARAVPPAISDWLARLHVRNGVALKLGQPVVAIDDRPDGVSVHLGDGSTLSGGHVLVGIGILPETSLACASGLLVDDGIVVDESGQTSDPAIFAAGDATRQPCPMHRGTLRLESWANAQNQAIAAARSALGEPQQRPGLPWFWSDQYGANLQVLGRSDLAARARALSAPTADRASWMLLDAEGALVGAAAVNAPRDLREIRKRLERSAVANASASGDRIEPVCSGE